MSTRERSPREEIVDQQIRLMRQEADQGNAWGWNDSLESIAHELKYHVAKAGDMRAFRPIWPPGGEPGPDMQF
ncbi:MAG: hypothetical protein HC828_12400 [Blastochloris sp.]|nr:hypothetical protein [Blastochloris sp.]